MPQYEGKSPFVRSRRRRKDNVTMDLEGIGWECVNCTWFRIGTSGEHDNERQVPQNAKNCFTS
jgi:hypothetical protein